jgi:hypothetical protein
VERNWLPRDEVRRLIACIKKDPPTFVLEFIDQTSTTWNVQKLQLSFSCIFIVIDIEVIRAIPLSTRRTEDLWAWHFERT